MAKSSSDTKKQNHCDFCGRAAREVGPLISGRGDGVFICPSCIGYASDALIAESRKQKGALSELKLLAPRQIVEYLDQYVVGQTKAKRTMAVAVCNHYKRLISLTKKEGPYSGVQLDKSSVLMIGPTGCGKTLIAKTLAETLSVPFAIGDATTLTEAGYVGEDVETLLLKLIQSADGDIKWAQTGILYVDEIDKISASRGNVSLTRDVSGEGVQQGLLKMLEGTTANVPPGGGRKHPEQKYIPFDTTHVLFICGGTFVGLEDIIRKRLGRRQIGFNAEANVNDGAKRHEILSMVTPDDLAEYGMIPEFVGRLPVLVNVEQLGRAALRRILTEPKNAILRQYQKLFWMDGINLVFEENAVEEIAKQASKRDTGARALRAVVETVMQPLMFDLPEVKAGETVKVDAKMVVDMIELNQKTESAIEVNEAA